MRYEPIDKTLFEINRKKFIAELKPKAMAIFHSNDQMPRSGDQYFPFRQNSDFFRLTGIDQEEAILLLFPDARKEEHREILFIRPTNDYVATWEGEKFSKEEASQISGIQNVQWTTQFDSIFQPLLYKSKWLYLNVAEKDRFSSPVKSKDHRFVEAIKEKYPLHKLERSQPILRSLSMIKSTFEVELMRKACDITQMAFSRVLKMVEPDIYEYEIEAEVIREFIRLGAAGHAYQPIIASGKSACILHYIKNDKKCKAGDLILMDFGAEYANYAADLSRTIPVGGRYNERQKAVYTATLNIFKAAKEMYVPGNTMVEIQNEVEGMMGYELKNLGLIQDADDKAGIQKYFMHGIGHHLGCDVHDPANRQVPLQEGMVITCEPGIYIAEEHLGIRIENNILVTNNGPIDLMKEIPIEIDEIEEIMNTKLIDIPS